MAITNICRNIIKWNVICDGTNAHSSFIIRGAVREVYAHIVVVTVIRFMLCLQSRESAPASASSHAILIDHSRSYAITVMWKMMVVRAGAGRRRLQRVHEGAEVVRGRRVRRRRVRGRGVGGVRQSVEEGWAGCSGRVGGEEASAGGGGSQSAAIQTADVLQSGNCGYSRFGDGYLLVCFFHLASVCARKMNVMSQMALRQLMVDAVIVRGHSQHNQAHAVMCVSSYFEWRPRSGQCILPSPGNSLVYVTPAHLIHSTVRVTWPIAR